MILAEGSAFESALTPVLARQFHLCLLVGGCPKPSPSATGVSRAMRTITERRSALRQVLEGERLQVPASVFDPVSARIAGEVGFAVGFLSGALVSFARLGSPDLGLLTLDELAAQARQVTRAADLPILADGDHGYGNALNVRRMIEELELAGVAGVAIEDTDLPVGSGPQRLIAVELACGKLRAALQARSDPNLVIIGRTSLATQSRDQLAERVEAYANVGVDGLFLTGLKSPDELADVPPGMPLIVLAAPQVTMASAALLAAGVRLVLKNGHDAFLAATLAIRDSFVALAQSGPDAKGRPLADYVELSRLMGEPQAQDWLRAYDLE